MAAWVCLECTTVYSVDAPRCPHCGGFDYAEQGSEGDTTMPKATVHGGASIFDPDAEATEAEPVGEATDESEGDQSSSATEGGTDSSTSSPSAPKKSGGSARTRQ